MRFRIQRLQWVGAAIAAVACLTLAGTSISSSMTDYRRSQLGGKEFTRFQDVLMAATSISAERGPANSLMGATDAQKPAFAAALAAKRAETDAFIERVDAELATRFYSDATLRLKMDALRQQLRKGRRAVDAVAADPPNQRSATQVVSAIEAMFAATDRSLDLRDNVAGSLIRISPLTAAEIMLASMIVSLRDNAGRVGSAVVMMLSSNAHDDTRYRSMFNENLAHVKRSFGLLRHYATAYFQSELITQKLDEVEIDFFKTALPYAGKTAAADALGVMTPIDEFTEEYVSGMQSMSELRDVVLETAESTMTDALNRAFRDMIVALALASTAILVLAALAITFRNALFRPLQAVRQQIIAIAQDDLSQPQPIRHVDPDIRDMFARLDVLREQQRVKRRLELDRLHMAERLKQLAGTDPLTGLLNRRALNEAVAALFDGPRAAQPALAVVMLDVDHFKAVNDRHGHSAGDLVLRHVVAVIAPQLRNGDIFARYGGEEFLIILRDVAEEDARRTAERLRRTLEETTVGGHNGLSVTASFGVSWHRQSDPDIWEKLVRTADERLYRAKTAGRNRVWTGKDDAAQGITARSAA